MEQKRVALSKKEFGDQLGVSRDSVIRAIQKQKIRTIKFGRRVLIPRTELERVIRDGV